MKKCIFLLVFLNFLYSSAQAQNYANQLDSAHKIISSYDEYPDYNDTSKNAGINLLLNLSKEEDYKRYAYDTSLIMRYIGFMGTLYYNDEKAYEILKKYINDTTEIRFRVPCTIYEIYSYNERIIQEYYTHIYYRYKEGNLCCDIMCRFLSSGQKDVKTFTYKREVLINMLKLNSMKKSVAWIKKFDQLAKNK